MASLQFEGEISDLSEVQIQYLRDVLSKRGFESNTVVLEPVGSVGDNFVANVKRVKVLEEDSPVFSLVMKVAPTTEQQRILMGAAILFTNEIYMYTEVLPKLSSLEVSAGIPEQERLRYAECYGCLTDELHELILLEDLREAEFVMLDKMKPLSNEAVRLVLKDFAKIHSLSFALKKFEPETYDTYKSQLTDFWNHQLQSEFFLPNIAIMEEAILAMIDEDKYKRLVKGCLTQLPELGKKLVKSQASSKHLVIQQGDAWSNNILFKMQDNEPTQCVMIDYQLSREANPVSDILYMILNCTDYKTNTKHFHDWMDYYHTELDNALSNYGLKANFVFSKDQLDADLKRYSKLYFGTAVMVLSMIVKKPEEAAEIKEAMKKDYNQMKDSTVSLETMALFKTKVIELIDSCLELGYL